MVVAVVAVALPQKETDAQEPRCPTKGMEIKPVTPDWEPSTPPARMGGASQSVLTGPLPDPEGRQTRPPGTPPQPSPVQPKSVSRVRAAPAGGEDTVPGATRPLSRDPKLIPTNPELLGCPRPATQRARSPNSAEAIGLFVPSDAGSPGPRDAGLGAGWGGRGGGGSSRASFAPGQPIPLPRGRLHTTHGGRFTRGGERRIKGLARGAGVRRSGGGRSQRGGAGVKGRTGGRRERRTRETRSPAGLSPQASAPRAASSATSRSRCGESARGFPTSAEPHEVHGQAAPVGRQVRSAVRREPGAQWGSQQLQTHLLVCCPGTAGAPAGTGSTREGRSEVKERGNPVWRGDQPPWAAEHRASPLPPGFGVWPGAAPTAGNFAPGQTGPGRARVPRCTRWDFAHLPGPELCSFSVLHWAGSAPWPLLKVLASSRPWEGWGKK